MRTKNFSPNVQLVKLWWEWDDLAKVDFVSSLHVWLLNYMIVPVYFQFQFRTIEIVGYWNPCYATIVGDRGMRQLIPGKCRKIIWVLRITSQLIPLVYITEANLVVRQTRIRTMVKLFVLAVHTFIFFLRKILEIWDFDILLRQKKFRHYWTIE